LTLIVVDAANQNYSSLDGVLCNKAGSILIRCPPGLSGSYAIPFSIRQIQSLAFAGCSELTNISLHDRGISIADNTFLGCTSLTTIIYGDGAIHSDDFTYSGCTALNSVIFMGNASNYTTGSDMEYFFGVDAADVVLYYFDDSIGFTSPTWFGYTSVNMGARTQVSTWLIDNHFPYNADLNDDHNGDGVNLLMAYALALDPKQNLSGSIPRPVIAGDQMSLTFRAGSEGITYKVETSDNLQNWSAEGVTLSAPDINGYRTAWFSGGGPNRFMRLAVSR
jgi:hypothetical protein